MSALVFLDTETTGLSLDDDIWEFAAIRREEDGREESHHLFIRHDTQKCARLPESFLADHQARFPASHTGDWHPDTVSREQAAKYVAHLFRGRPHVVGAVPNFDTERLALLLRWYGYEPSWHYHLIDVENLAVGWLAAKGDVPDLPWDSDVISLACGVEPPTDDRHTAMGDVRWVMAWYDAITGGTR